MDFSAIGKLFNEVGLVPFCVISTFFLLFASGKRHTEERKQIVENFLVEIKEERVESRKERDEFRKERAESRELIKELTASFLDKIKTMKRSSK